MLPFDVSVKAPLEGGQNGCVDVGDASLVMEGVGTLWMKWCIVFSDIPFMAPADGGTPSARTEASDQRQVDVSPLPWFSSVRKSTGCAGRQRSCAAKVDPRVGLVKNSIVPW